MQGNEFLNRPFILNNKINDKKIKLGFYRELSCSPSSLGFEEHIRSKLLLNVYQKNIPAISFYQREGFEIQYSGMDEATGEKDYVMVWQQK